MQSFPKSIKMALIISLLQFLQVEKVFQKENFKNIIRQKVFLVDNFSSLVYK